MSLLIACLFCVLPTAARAQVVPPPPPPPVVTAYAVAATTTRNTPVNIQFNGTTSRGSLTYSTTTDPISGTLGPIEGDTIVYTPSTGYVGTDTFVYQVFSTPTSQTATVTITILGPDTTAPIITAPATQYFSTTTVPANRRYRPESGHHERCACVIPCRHHHRHLDRHRHIRQSREHYVGRRHHTGSCMDDYERPINRSDDRIIHRDRDYI